MSTQSTPTREQILRPQAGKYLTFKLGAEEFGLEILKVQEIIKLVDVTRVPHTPAFVRGVINLRGKIIPVIDLRLKFAMPAQANTVKTCVIVVQVTQPTSRVTMGVIVDEVAEVLDISDAQIEPPPEFGVAVDTEFMLGLGKVEQRVIMLLASDHVLSPGEVATVAAATIH